MATNPKAHAKHSKRIVTEVYKLRNVAYTVTHELVRCDCGWFGWITKDQLASEPASNFH